ncbi:Antibiotic biosynthesis monooxygenase [Mycena sanguinolenta]|uniref:Antibiotic biosynthesis monooxygenase n=1 Tax=Mycena sanguinolenta TaxID=230812 RepID=A0A8H6ZB35_9AGAR|nr:Antibiotic biosynthesis monooxygenase [Mycena sanguinolenta]
MLAFFLASLLLLQLLQPVLGDVSLALLVPAIAKSDQVNATQKFLEGAIPLVQAEPGTIQWYGVQFTDVDPPTSLARSFANADTLFVADPIINKANVLASKVQNGDGSLTEGLSVGLRVNFTAKEDKVQDVQNFLTGALSLVEAEPDTLFLEGREEHLNGKVAAALFAQADMLFTGQPDIVKFDVLSADVKSKSGQTSGAGMGMDSGSGSGSGTSNNSGMSTQTPSQNPDSGVSLALLVPAIAKGDQVNATQNFLEGAIPLVQAEPGTIQWYGVQFTDVDPPTFAIFDTFNSEADRNTHLNGKVAGALFANADTLFIADPVINKANVLASKVQNGDGSLTEGLSVGLRVNFTAKEDKVQDVRDFLTNALTLVEAEPDTLFWYAVEFNGTCVFSIVDFFASEKGREEHLNGKVAAALFAQADMLFTGQPDIVKFDVLSADVKSQSGQTSGSGRMGDGMAMGSGSSTNGNYGTGMQQPYQPPIGTSGIPNPEQFCQQLCQNLVNTLMKNSGCKTT